MSENELLSAAATALKALAASADHRAAFARNPLLRETLWPAASRYIVARDRAGMLARMSTLASYGYRLGVEYVGEEVHDADEVELAVQENEAMIEAAGPSVQLGFDLSSIGSMVSADLAHDNAARLLKAAAVKDMTLVLSMERSTFVGPILEVYGALAAEHDNIAITLQAHLHRSVADVGEVAARGGKVRLVKGVYREPPEVALPRGPELDRRYVELLRTLLDRGVPVAVGTQAPELYALMAEAGLLARVEEAEMLHGMRPWLLRRLRDQGIATRILAVYGENWWLHFLHRLAEQPHNVLIALADLADPTRIRFGQQYR